MKTKTAWVARDEMYDGLKLHWTKPVRTGRYLDAKQWWWSDDWTNLPSHMYQGLDWEDEPLKVKVELKPF